MKKLFLIFLLSPLIALANQNDFSFYDSGKSFFSSISELSKEISEQSEYIYKPIAIVVASRNMSEHYKNQFEYLYKLDAENLSLIYISALSDNSYTHGYHTDGNVADKMLDSRDFFVIIYSTEGEILYASDVVLTDIEIETIVNKYNNLLH